MQLHATNTRCCWTFVLMYSATFYGTQYATTVGTVLKNVFYIWLVSLSLIPIICKTGMYLWHCCGDALVLSLWCRGPKKILNSLGLLLIAWFTRTEVIRNRSTIHHINTVVVTITLKRWCQLTSLEHPDNTIVCRIQVISWLHFIRKWKNPTIKILFSLRWL